MILTGLLNMRVFRDVHRAYRRTQEGWERSPLLPYVALFLLQLKVIWGAWRYLDLTAGDTSSYYVYATLWMTDLGFNVAWSPLYTAFYGTLLALIDNVYAATVWHRLLIVFAASGLVLAVLRRLLPLGLAWLLAAWWVVLPANFGTAFEVHLFALVPVLAAWLTSLQPDSTRARGSALAILFAASILVRNELILATLAFGGVCLVWEIRNSRRDWTGGRGVARLAAYAIPVLAAALACVFVYTRSIAQFPSLWFFMREKHVVNMCQVYAFGYKQRHSDWQGDHWMQCQELMKAHFGEPLPSLWEMVRSNAGAVLEHFRWNLSLTPAGEQVSLFNATAGSVTPDYGEVNSGSYLALVLSIAMALIVLAGLTVLYKERRYWWSHWIRDRAQGWCAILSMVPVWIVVILTQRPRPSYLFSLSVFLMALVGMSVFVITRRLRWTRRLLPAVPILAVILLIAVPSYYGEPDRAGPRPLLEMYRRLSPFQDLIADSETVLLVSHFGFDIKHYLGLGLPPVIEYQSLQPVLSTRPLRALLDEQGVNLFYLDEALSDRLRSPIPRALLESTAWTDWKLLGSGDHTTGRWRLWARSPSNRSGSEPAREGGRRRSATAWIVPGGEGPAGVKLDRSDLAVHFQPGRFDPSVLVSGWSTPETWGVWSDGPEARVMLDPKRAESRAGHGGFILIARARSLVAPQHPRQLVDVFVNDTLVATWTFDVGDDLRDLERRARVPAALVAGRLPVTVTFTCRNPVSPVDLGVGRDRRRLGIALADLWLVPAGE
jgi:hypothetical protein